MTTQDLAEVMASDSGLTKVQADKAINSRVSNLTNALKNNEEVHISDFGTFTTSRIPKNPGSGAAASGAGTGRSADYETIRVPNFEPGSKLLSAIR